MFETIPKSRIFINFLLILEIFIGLAIIAVTWFYQRKLSIFLIPAEEDMLTSRFINVYILGFQLVASFLCGISLWATVWPRRYTDNIQLLLSMWLIFCFLIVICGGVTIWSLLASSNTLSESAEVILLKGIDIYYMNPEWKLLWDGLQYTKECCGVHSYKDWMHATWMSNKEFIDVHNCEEVQYVTTECSIVYEDSDDIDLELLPQHEERPQILAPYACCKHNSTFCYENYMPHIKRDGVATRLPHLNLTEINTQGCFPFFIKHLTFALHLLFILILLAIVVDIIICFFTKYLMATNYKRCYREFYNDSRMYDDEGNALVVIKCPPNVKCITLEEPHTYSGSDIPNLVSSFDLHPCCCAEHDTAADLDDNLGANRNNNNFLVH